MRASISHALPAAQYPSSSTLTVMVAGDSQISALGDGPRTALWTELRRRRGNVRLVGTQWSVLPSYYQLAHGDNEGWPGYQIAEIFAGRAGAGGILRGIASIGAPDVIVMIAGSNDVAAHAALIHAATETQGQAVAAMVADMTAGVAALRAAAPQSRIVLSTMPPYLAPAANAAEGTPLAIAYNAALLASGLGDARVDATSALTAADLQADGIHLARTGCSAVGAAWAVAVEAVAQRLPSGVAWPAGVQAPPFIRRSGKQASVNFTTTSDVVSLAAQKGSVIGASSFLVALNFYPTSIPGTLRSLWVLAGTGIPNAIAICSNAAGMAIYSAGAGAPAIQTTDAPAVLVANTWHQIVVWWDAASLTVTLYVNGMAIARKPVAAWSIGGSTVPAVLGNTANFAIGGGVGYYDSALLAVGASLPDAAHQSAAVEALYLRGTLPPGLSSLYHCTEGSGSSAADALGGTAATLGGSAAWVAIGTANKPWDL